MGVGSGTRAGGAGGVVVDVVGGAVVVVLVAVGAGLSRYVTPWRPMSELLSTPPALVPGLSSWLPARLPQAVASILTS